MGVPVHPYATMVPGRDPAFKTHPDIGAVRLAVSHTVVPVVFGPHQKVIRRFRTGIQVCRFDPHQAEYTVWIAPRAHDPLCDYPQLMANESDDPWLIPGDVASLLGISIAEVGKLIRDGVLNTGVYRADSRVRQSQVLEVARDGVAAARARRRGEEAHPVHLRIGEQP